MTALVVEDASRNPMTWALETIDSLSAQTGAGRGPLGRDYHALVFAFLCNRHSGSGFRCMGSIKVYLLLGILTGSLVTQLDLASPLRAKKTIPEDEERLGEIGLDTPALVVDVMVSGVVGGEMLQWIPGEGIATVIIDSLDSREGEEPHGLAVSHAGDQESNSSASRIQEESLNRVVVESTEGIWNIETVMTGVEGHCGG